MSYVYYSGGTGKGGVMTTVLNSSHSVLHRPAPRESHSGWRSALRAAGSLLRNWLMRLSEVDS